MRYSGKSFTEALINQICVVNATELNNLVSQTYFPSCINAHAYIE